MTVGTATFVVRHGNLLLAAATLLMVAWWVSLSVAIVTAGDGWVWRVTVSGAGLLAFYVLLTVAFHKAIHCVFWAAADGPGSPWGVPMTRSGRLALWIRNQRQTAFVARLRDAAGEIHDGECACVNSLDDWWSLFYRMAEAAPSVRPTLSRATAALEFLSLYACEPTREIERARMHADEYARNALTAEMLAAVQSPPTAGVAAVAGFLLGSPATSRGSARRGCQLTESAFVVEMHGGDGVAFYADAASRWLIPTYG